MNEIYDKSETEKAFYLERKFWDLSDDNVKSLLKPSNFSDDRLYSLLVYRILSNFSRLDKISIAKIKNIFNIDLSCLTKILEDNVNIEISDVIDFKYDYESELYYYKTNKLLSYISESSNIDECINIINTYRKYRERKEFNIIVSKLDKNKFLNYKLYEDSYYNEMFNKNNIDFNDKFNTLMLKKFNVTLKNFLKLIKQISENFSDLNDCEIEIPVEFKQIIRCYKNKDFKLLTKLYNELPENQFLFESLESNYKYSCCRDVSDTIRKFNPNKEHLKKEGAVLIYDISLENFNLLIHRTNSVGNNFKTNNDDFLDIPINKGKTTISCSGISNMYLGRVENDEEEKVCYFGFSNISPLDIVDMGPENINISDMINDEMPDSIYGRNFNKFDKLLEKSFDQYNEIALFRENQQTTERIRPNYIACFDKIDNYSMKMAEKYNIPIYFIDTKKVYNKANITLNNLVNDDRSFATKKASISLLNKILSYAYDAYSEGKIVIDDSLLEKYFLRLKSFTTFDDNFKNNLLKYAMGKNENIGFGLADNGEKYKIH